MASFIYFYSKFTEEFLLLNATLLFGTLALYLYHWVVKRRRLGAAGQFVPSEIVNVYLNQLVNEAQFVRNHLFGILNDSKHTDTAAFRNMMSSGNTAAPHTDAPPRSENGAIPEELMNRLGSLENQLSEKEGMIVNINVEKTKLMQEITALKAAQKAGAASAAAGDQADLLKRIKLLEQQLEEYALFEEDLANIKRIQQENDQLKKQIEELSKRAQAAPVKATANVPDSEAKLVVDDHHGPSLDQAAIDALLDGSSPIPPTVTPVAKLSVVPDIQPANENITPVSNLANNLNPSAVNSSALNQTDQFDKLAESVGSSLDSLVTAPAAVATAPTATAPTAPEPSVNEILAQATDASATETPDSLNKTDEELLKEFENLLNSG
jgi:hypothetical protein